MRFALRHLLSVFMLVLLLGLFVGCSTTAMKSTPLWDREYEKANGPAEDRINVWPLFYYRNPALSALWPLISATDEGHAFVPFYEYDKSDRHMRLGTLHQIAPAFADFNGEDETKRVFNVMSDKKEHTFWVLPFYFQDCDDKELYIIPVLYKSEDGFWTPLYTHTRDLKGFFGPLFFRYAANGSTRYFFPWPILGFWSGDKEKGFRAFPLGWYNRRGDYVNLNLGLLLYNYMGRSDWKQHDYLWPLGQYSSNKENKTNRLIPLFYANEKNGKKFLWVLGPLFTHWADKNERGHCTLPFYYYNSESDRDYALITTLGGISKSKERERLDVLGPLYYRSESTTESYHTVMWPLWHDYKTTDSRKIALFPAFMHSEGSKERKFVSIPMSFGRKGEDSFFNLGLVLFHREKNAESTGTWLAPLFYHVEQSAGSSVYTLPLSFGKMGDVRFMNVGLLLYNHEISPRRTKRYFPMPFAGYESRRNEQGEREGFSSWLFPIFSYEDQIRQRNYHSLLTRIERLKPDRQALEEEFRKNLPERLKSLSSETKPYPINQSHKLYEYSYLFRLANFQSSLHSVAKPVEKQSADDAQSTPSLPISYLEKDWDVRHTQTDTGYVFPLFHYDKREGEGATFSLLWRLYDSAKKGDSPEAQYTRRRVLWRVFHRESEGERISTDVFPFIAMDKGKDLRKFSFMGGLVEFGKKDGTSNLKLFYIPLKK